MTNTISHSQSIKKMVNFSMRIPIESDQLPVSSDVVGWEICKLAQLVIIMPHRLSAIRHSHTRKVDFPRFADASQQTQQAADLASCSSEPSLYTKTARPRQFRYHFITSQQRLIYRIFRGLRLPENFRSKLRELSTFSVLRNF